MCFFQEFSVFHHGTIPLRAGILSTPVPIATSQPQALTPQESGEDLTSTLSQLKYHFRSPVLCASDLISTTFPNLSATAPPVSHFSNNLNKSVLGRAPWVSVKLHLSV